MRPLHLPAPPFNVLWVEQVDSTNLVLQRRLEAWEGAGRMGETLLVAGSQTAGRGRGRREWVSPAGGLYATWFGWVRVEVLGVIPIAAAVALAEALEAVAPAMVVGFKWPNDLMVGGKKVGGVLAQARISAGEAGVIVGFGSNLATTPVVDGPGAAPTSAVEWGWVGDPVASALAVAVDCVTRLHGYLAAPARAQRVWAARSVHHPGEELRLRAGDEVVRGRFAGFGAAGQLFLEVEGEQREFFAADLVAAL